MGVVYAPAARFARVTESDVLLDAVNAAPPRAIPMIIPTTATKAQSITAHSTALPFGGLLIAMGVFFLK
jgi:hypothetical protein